MLVLKRAAEPAVAGEHQEYDGPLGARREQGVVGCRDRPLLRRLAFEFGVVGHDRGQHLLRLHRVGSKRKGSGLRLG